MLAATWFAVLALVAAGPLLGRGRLILLDFPAVWARALPHDELLFLYATRDGSR